MSSQLNLAIGQCSDKGRKEVNQDFFGVAIPKEPHLSLKGVAVALADGISSSNVSQIASETAVKTFLEDYFCTSEANSVRNSALQVIRATNSWLHNLTQQSQYRYDKDRGYVCTLSALIIKSTTAHILHVGDSRIYRLRAKQMEQLTQDHRHWVTEHEHYLSRALGIHPQLDIDYQAIAIERGDIFILATDGVYEFATSEFIINCIFSNQHDLNHAAKEIVSEAYANGSTDNLTIQIVRLDELATTDANEIYDQLSDLPFPPILEPRSTFDGYQIIREVHATSRSHVYLAVDTETNEQVIIKTPSIDLRSDNAYLERFLMEEWIARRINSAHVLKPCKQTRKRNFIYIVTEYIEGQTLTQWLIDNPKPDLETVRGIVEQIAKGLLAFHRKEMLHQDLRPENIMIDHTGTVKIIDFGSTRVAGIREIATNTEQHNLLGTAQYSAPEYFLGENGSVASDIFSLGVITYQMLSGHLPYGAQVAQAKTRAAQNRLVYRSVLDDEREIPVWIDDVLKKAVNPNPYKRYQELSEFTTDLRRPTQAFLNRTRPPLIERNPALFWKSVSFILFAIIVLLLFKQYH
ncbi:protein kinase [Cellvibrio zantedeschiae]|uniref:Protein kinase n=1 Tax=Cellvibrio zantedeschiae TaxID=1237077 RepID=A0ABQ3AQZ8_9GAMM|nr:bifunctional protein-serine/threonine kinase/phosphatase [Cellvibrio zantedeschiae]GGY64539.1 protein kinase [Cellvibrio zantedeschiae]